MFFFCRGASRIFGKLGRKLVNIKNIVIEKGGLGSGGVCYYEIL